MPNRLRRFSKRVLLIINAVLVFIFLLSCLVPYLNPQTWWFISFLGLAFPFLLFLVIVFGIGWLVVMKPKFALVSGIALLIAIPSISYFFAFHISSSFSYKKEKGVLRVLSWNVARFVELKRNNNKGSSVRLKMFEEIKRQDADVLCLQEFHTSTIPEYYDNITSIQQDLGYPYYYFSFDNDGDQHYYSSIIFSRIPLIDSSKLRYPRPTLPDVLLGVDLKLGNDTIRIYTTHLQSLQFMPKDYERLNKIANARDSLITNSKNILSKLRKGITYRSIQARQAHDVIKNSPHPVIFCGDLNDVPNSYTYHLMRSGMQDAFLKKGFGIGRTFAALSPTLRIDYIFADSHFKIKQFNRLVKNYSDHYMIVCDVALKK
jgi:endonuclease/exonuclease/phosphatase family metal-dependent hydrolase